ncbi:hypothetical protein AB1Y20_008319 [Prymnesium parvum]|uniref:AAA+ ATPase domain-containing protein n=1 Tax=Prymnesium parvum TaxID=97485 RepID=A0AB34IWR0_PRYPA
MWQRREPSARSGGNIQSETAFSIFSVRRRASNRHFDCVSNMEGSGSRREARLARLQRELEPGSRKSRLHRASLDSAHAALNAQKAEVAAKAAKARADRDDDGDDECEEEEEEEDEEEDREPPPPMQPSLSLRPRRSVHSYKEPSLVAGSPAREKARPTPPAVGDIIEVEVAKGKGSVEWQPAEVRQLLSRGRFKVCINRDEQFIEEYGMEDEGGEWRRTAANGKYSGLKRQRRAVDRLEVGMPRRREFGDAVSTKVGPFRTSQAGGRSKSSRERGGGGESDTLDSEEEFAARSKRSTARLSRGVQPLLGGEGQGGVLHRLPRTPEDFAEADRRQAAADEASALRASQVRGPGAQSREGDVQPMAIDASIGWDQVGGLHAHVEALREMVLLPLLYPEVFDQLGVTPPRGVLFHGPPGTGKTLVARALANNCSAAGQPVAFFMRKGADVLSKWVGEAEKQLRLLFAEAYRQQPSIIFFDEIDGLAPVRSSRQDQIHASIVSTLLALMDGLDSRGKVILIGATNRIDALDAALRRPGRFDRELQFSLPARAGREEILKIHTAKWQPPPSAELLSELAEATHGYCGADLRALCSEAALAALRAAYPQIFTSSRKYELPPHALPVAPLHFERALAVVTPAAHRAVALAGAPLPPSLAPLLAPTLHSLLEGLAAIFPPLATPSSSSHAAASATARAPFRGAAAPVPRVGGVAHPTTCRPHLLLCGEGGNGHGALAGALVHALEHCHRYSLDLPQLVADGSRTLQEACAHVFAEARRTTPAVVFMPAIDSWLLDAEPICFHTVQLLVHQLPPGTPLLLLGTCETPLASLDEQQRHRLLRLFPYEHHHLTSPSAASRAAAFDRFEADATLPPPAPPAAAAPPLKPLRLAPPPKPPRPSAAEVAAQRAAEAAAQRSMRMALRELCMRLGSDRRFRFWSRPVDREAEEGRAYLRKVGGGAMELATLLERVNEGHVASCSNFEAHLRRIVTCAKLYFDAQDEESMRQVARANALLDEGMELLQSLDPDMVAQAEAIAKARAARGEPELGPCQSKNALSRAKPRPSCSELRPSPSAAEAAAPAAEAAAEARARRAALRSREEDATGESAEAATPGATMSAEPLEAAAEKEAPPPRQEAEAEEAPPPFVPLDEAQRRQLAALVASFVAQTDGWRVDELEHALSDLYAVLVRMLPLASRAELLPALELAFQGRLAKVLAARPR